MLPPRIRVRSMLGNRNGHNATEAARPRDGLDHEIDHAAATGQPVDLEMAFPDPSAAPAERLAAIGHADNAVGYVKEYKLKLLHRLLMRNLPIDLISAQLDMHPRNVLKLRVELNRRLKAEAQNVDTYTFFGKTLGFYDEVRATALRIATDTKIASGSRVAALGTAVAADSAKLRFLEMAGFFDHNRFAPPPKENIDSVERGRKALGLIFNASLRTLNGDDDVSYTIDEADLDAGAEDDDVNLL
jgi:hypothetical protein